MMGVGGRLDGGGSISTDRPNPKKRKFGIWESSSDKDHLEDNHNIRFAAEGAVNMSRVGVDF